MPFSTRRLDPSRVAFQWGVKGRPPHGLPPNGAPELALQAICRRTSVFIWHIVSGIVDASSGTPVVTSLRIRGSRFPTHQAWLDNVALPSPVAQAELVTLWDPDPRDPTRVR